VSSPVDRFEHTGPIWSDHMAVQSGARIVCFRMVLLLLVMKRKTDSLPHFGQNRPMFCRLMANG
jgi:hypothetical protein